MAHSFLSVIDDSSDRSVGVVDSVLFAFLYFFIDTCKVMPNECENKLSKICFNYLKEKEQRNLSFINLYLDEVFIDKEARLCYLEHVSRVESRLSEMGEEISVDFLSKEINLEFSIPLKVYFLTDLINDIKWILRVEDAAPSGRYVYYEDPLT